jgi:hypothetical protein
MKRPELAARRGDAPASEPRRILLGAAVLLNVAVDVRLWLGRPYLAAPAWLLSLGMIALAIPRDRAARERHPAFPRWALVVIALPAVARVLFFDLDRIHGDDLLTAFFSSSYPLRRDFFAPVPDEPWQWVAQFPAPFFFFQKVFFLVFGESLLTVKLSVLPYVIALTAFLYAIAHELLDEAGAFLAVLAYAFFGPSLYLETLGLHFVSSTTMFVALLYVAIREHQTGDSRLALASGMLSGACYLFYLSSFLALPIGAAFIVAGIAAARPRSATTNLCLYLLGAALVVGPFVVDGLRHGNYFLRRFDQVALLGGEWSPYKDALRSAPRAREVVVENARLCFRALWQAGLGGHGGYDFGHQALLAPIVLALVVLGALRALVLGRRRREWWALLAIVVLSFVTGMVLTIPPPAFHRASLAFPLLALFAALPLHACWTARRESVVLRRVVPAVVALAVAFEGILYLERSALTESPASPLQLARFVNERFPGRPLYVAAFPSYAFEKVYHFAPNRRATQVVTGYHKDLLPKLDPTRPYVYVITLPNDFDGQFAARDPHGRIIRFTEEYSLFVN